jgi:hypothetical protein
MVRQEPYLTALFDVHTKVLTKIIMRSLDTISEKAIPQLLEKIAHLPAGISVLV